MNNATVPTPVLNDIQQFFGFILAKGYRMSSVKSLPMGDWEVQLESNENTIIIYSDHADINLAVGPVHTKATDQIGIRALIYFLSNGQRFIGKYKKSIFNDRKKRLKELADLLQEYLDQILPLFGVDFEKNRFVLTEARKKYNDLYMDRYIPKRKPSDWE